MAPSAQAAAPVLGWAAIARKVVPAVVNIEVLTIAKDSNSPGLGERQEEVGSGFIVNPTGIIVTNKHVIDGAFQITVTLQDGTELPAKLIAAAKLTDIAVLKVDAGHPLPVLPLAPPGAVQPGDPVLAIGNPEGVGTSFSAGIVSAVNRNLMKSPFDDYVQTDAAINHGNSGGPLVDTKGEVVGVDTILLTNMANEGSNGLGFAISSTVVGYVIRHLLYPAAAPVGWIGTQLQDLTPALAKAFGIKQWHGFVVTGIDADSPAQQAGLEAGDVILSYGAGPDQPHTARELMGDLTLAPIGKPVRLEVWRGGKTFWLPVTVRVWPNLMEARGAMGPPPGTNLPLPSPDLGLLLSPITTMARQQFALGKLNGVLVVAVDRQSDAYVHGIQAGDVIERIQDQPARTANQVYRLARQAARTRQFVAVLVHLKAGNRWMALHVAEPVEVEAGTAVARVRQTDTPNSAAARTTVKAVMP
ncbi:MAG: trypsin-like peptidase domain-containing protein, partial [Acetobacteraceae bacterium]